MTSVLSPSFRWLWRAALVSGFGDGVRLGAIPLVAAAHSSNPLAISTVAVAGTLPWLVVGPLTGVLIDRLTRRKLALVSSDLVSSLVVGALSILVLAGLDDISVLVGINILLGSVQTLRDGIAVAVVPQLEGANTLNKANGRMQAVQVLTGQVAGPPLGVGLFLLTPPSAFAFDAVSYLMAAAMVSMMLTHVMSFTRRDHESPGLWDSLTTGWTFLLRTVDLRSVCVLLGIMSFSVQLVSSTVVVYALRELDAGPGGYALVIASLGTGTILGALTSERVSTRLGYQRSLLIAALLGVLGYTGVGLSEDAYSASALTASIGFSIGLANVVSTSLRHVSVPSELFGRVNSTYRMFVVGLAPVGATVGGALVSGVGLRSPYFLAAVLLGLGSAMVWRMWSRPINLGAS